MKSYNEAVGSKKKNKKQKEQAEVKEENVEQQTAQEPKVIGIKKK